MWAGDTLKILGDNDGYFYAVTDEGHITYGSGNWALKKTDILAALSAIGKTYTDDQVVVSPNGYELQGDISDWEEFETI